MIAPFSTLSSPFDIIVVVTSRAEQMHPKMGRFAANPEGVEMRSHSHQILVSSCHGRGEGLWFAYKIWPKLHPSESTHNPSETTLNMIIEREKQSFLYCGRCLGWDWIELKRETFWIDQWLVAFVAELFQSFKTMIATDESNDWVVDEKAIDLLFGLLIDN